MPEESTTPGLAELMRRIFDALGRGDLEALMGFFGPDAVLDLTSDGIGTFEGAAGVRRFAESWQATYEQWRIKAEEILDLGGGVTFALAIQSGRPVGIAGEVQQRNAWVCQWENDLVVRATGYHASAIEEARAAAERLAQEGS
jgi:ketosteroid isomerase-like protein